MKIGILTYHKAFNYGAFMQAYSLQKTLENRYPEYVVELVDFVPIHEVYRYWLKVPTWILLHQGFSAMMKQYKKYTAFVKAWKCFKTGKNAGFTKKRLRKRLKDYDYVIVGSDAVFNDSGLTGSTGVSPFFLENTLIPKASYAASAHGLDYSNFNKEKAERIYSALDSFDILSVRDKHTEAFVHKMLHDDNDKRVIHSCDPTVFLPDFNENDEIREQINKLRSKHKKIIAFMLKTEKYGEVIKRIEDDECYYIALANYNQFADIQLIDIDPFKWATCLKYVDYVVTDYFHGTLVSLQQCTPVISIDISVEKNGNKTKIADLLLDRLHLSEFYFTREEFEREQSINRIRNQCFMNATFDYRARINDSLKLEANSFLNFCEMFDRSIK